MPVPPVCKCGRPLRVVNQWECEPCKLAYADEVISLRERVKRLEYREQGYRELLSAVTSVSHRIGPARLPESIRGELEEIASRHRRWIYSDQPSASPAEPSEEELRQQARCVGWGPSRPCGAAVHPGYTICTSCYRPLSRAQIEAALKLPENAAFRPKQPEPDPAPLRTCMESLAQLGVEAQRLSRAGDNEALRGMAGRLTQIGATT